MGARLYNQVTGTFSGLDSVYGGGSTAYGYPNDLINNSDIDGKRWWRKAYRHLKKNRWRYTCYSTGLLGAGAAHGTYTGSIGGPFGGASFSFTATKGRPRTYASVGYNHNRSKGKKWYGKWSKAGGSVMWSPGYPNGRRKASGGFYGCVRWVCGGGQGGYKGRGVSRKGRTFAVGVGAGVGGYYSGGSRIWRSKKRWW